jgi:hypothetical protein
MVDSVTRGRGAWSPTGKDNGSRYYEHIAGKPLDGSSKDRDVNYQAVNLGVKAIQTRINAYGYSPALVVDGVFGPGTTAGAKWAQAKMGFSANQCDGRPGPTTCRALFKDLLIWFGGVHHVPASQLHGFIMLESVYDPGAVGGTTPSDRGLNQINLEAHKNITVEQAFDPTFSIDYTAKRLADARIRYSGKTVDLKTKCSIAQHNVPVAAECWYRDGVPPLGPVEYNGKMWDGWPDIEKYVNKVLGYALEFKA